ncbi:MAG TPA: hypothetical protein DHW71_00145 [Gammaproteobacteria bacterium]|nr:hypothetical protein [Gammaproteobacteria bacterium]
MFCFEGGGRYNTPDYLGTIHYKTTELEMPLQNVTQSGQKLDQAYTTTASEGVLAAITSTPSSPTPSIDSQTRSMNVPSSQLVHLPKVQSADPEMQMVEHIRSNNVQGVRDLIKQGFKFETAKKTLFRFALHKASREVMQAIAESGPKLDHMNAVINPNGSLSNQRITYLQMAFKESQSLETFKGFIDGLPNLNQKVNGASILGRAIIHGSDEQFQYLLDKKVSPNSYATCNGLMPLYLALKYGSQNKIFQLLKAGASLNVPVQPIEGRISTLEDFILAANEPKVCHSAVNNKLFEFNQETLSAIIKNDAAQMFNRLMLKPEARQAFVADLNSYPDILTMAIDREKNKVLSSMLKFEFDQRKCDRYGDMPIHAAAKKGNFEVVKTLLLSDASLINEENSDKQTLLELALKRPVVDLPLFLLKHKDIDVDRIIESDKSILLKIAIMANDSEAINKLFNAGLDHMGSRGQLNALECAIDKRQFDAAKSILNNYVKKSDKVGESIFNGATPLHLAANLNSVDTVKSILAKDPQAVFYKDDKGLTASQVAMKYGKDEVVDAIKQVSAQNGVLLELMRKAV